jgi:hypothetical protein
MIKPRDKVATHTPTMALFMKGLGNPTCSTVRGRRSGQMGVNTRVIIKMGRSQVLENTLGQTNLILLVNGSME